MENEKQDISQRRSSWAIMSGSLDDAITCESSVSAAKSDHTPLIPPLILRRPSPDSGPCEITISFTQQHEMKQVYVRSTARVYEIYCSANEKRENEYLCTVRCGPNLRSESNEDDWVDVERCYQDCFEATAEICDAEPVLSITLRLLSVQSGEYVCVEEVYVFADPVVSSHINPSTNAPETSSQSATMSLLIPTLLNLSNFRRKQIQQQDTDLKSEKLDSTSRLEKTLDELVSRVAKIEDFCLRFEEKMVKPISNMEARLERVEQQLESFVNTTLSMTGSARISAPEFARGNESPSIINSKPIEKDESRLQDLSIPPSDAYSPLSIHPSNVSSPTADAAQLIPSLVVTAPDFSFVDDEGENDSVEAEKDFPKGSVKKPLSINDALASALAGFLSSASNDIDVVEETADINEENRSSCPSELILSDELVVSSVNIDGNYISGKDNIVATEQESFGPGNGFEETTESVDGHNYMIEEGESEKSLGNSVFSVANLDQVKTDLSDLSLDRSRETDDGSNEAFVFGSSDSPDNDISVAALESPAANTDSCSGEETEKDCPGILLKILKLEKPAIVDFGIPILDVKFSPQEKFSAKSPLNALLVDVPDVCSEVPCVDEDNASSYSEKYDLVTIENADSTTLETHNSQLFCLDDYDSGYMPSNREEELQQCPVQDMGASLI